jgi:flagellar biosynthesis protein FlhG
MQQQPTVTAIKQDGERVDSNPKRARVVAITSGKGGVGKTNVTTNIAIALASQGQRVCIFDADTGLANINILLGLNPDYTLEHLLNGSRTIDEVLVSGPRGISIIPAASGIAEYAELNSHQQQVLLNSLQQLETRFDYLLIDTAAGIGDNVIEFIKAADQAILVISPDPTSLTDAFALTRVLQRKGYQGSLYSLVNMAESALSAKKIYTRFTQAVKKYIKVDVHYFGFVSNDQAVSSAVRLQHPVILMEPDAKASRCFKALANSMEDLFSGNSSQGFSHYWRKLLPDALVTPRQDNVEILNQLNPVDTKAGDLSELNRQFVDCIQGNKGDAEEFIAAIKPIIDAYVARFQTFPLDIREAIYKYLELADFPDQEIRNQVMMLETLYEKKHHRPLMDTEDNLFRLLNQVRDSEPEFADAISRLQTSYEQAYKHPVNKVVHDLVSRLQHPGVEEQVVLECVEQLKTIYEQRFDKTLSLPDEKLRHKVQSLVEAIRKREAQLQEKIALLTEDLSHSSSALDELQEILSRLPE